MTHKKRQACRITCGPVTAPRTRMRSNTSPVVADSRVTVTLVPIRLFHPGFSGGSREQVASRSTPSTNLKSTRARRRGPGTRQATHPRIFSRIAATVRPAHDSELTARTQSPAVAMVSGEVKWMPKLYRHAILQLRECIRRARPDRKQVQIVRQHVHLRAPLISPSRSHGPPGTTDLMKTLPSAISGSPAAIS